jgi:uncharacterized protein
VPDDPAPILRVERERDADGRPANARPRDRFGRPLPRGAVDEMPDRVEPDDVVGTIGEALEHAVALFDAQRFFEAHEFLEWIWKADDLPEGDRDFWKGVTQVAVGCVHVQRGNVEGALTLLGRAAGHLERVEPTRDEGIDRLALAACARALAGRVTAEGAHPGHDFPPLPRHVGDTG